MGPVTLSAGVKLKLLSGLTVTVPSAGFTVAVSTFSGSASTSKSLASTAMLAIGVFSGVEAVSLTTTGASLTALTDRLTLAVAVPPLPSMMV